MRDPLIDSVANEPVIIQDETVYEDHSPAHFEAHRVSVSYPNGTKANLHYAQTADDRCGAVCIIRDGQRIVLSRHWRAALNGSQLELPRGMGEKGETPEQTAEREALEETGLATRAPRILQFMHADSGVLRDQIAVVELHVDPTAAVRKTDGELEEWRWEDISHVRAMMKAGQITDGISLAALGILLLHQSSDGFFED